MGKVSGKILVPTPIPAYFTDNYPGLYPYLFCRFLSNLLWIFFAGTHMVWTKLSSLLPNLFMGYLGIKQKWGAKLNSREVTPLIYG